LKTTLQFETGFSYVNSNILVFDIETIPDVSAGRRLYDLPQSLSDEDTARAMAAKRRQKTGGSDFLQLPLHRIVAISVVHRIRSASKNDFKVLSLGTPDLAEDELEKVLIQKFFKGLDTYTPTLVSWNGSGFDLPVLNYRALMHGVVAEKYWSRGNDDRDFRYDNYLSRFHWRHTDLMDVLAGFQPRAAAPLDMIAVLCGYPGKLGMDGSAVWNTYLAGGLQQICDYCDTDVLNTYLVYLRFRLMSGELDEEEFAQECEIIRDHLQNSDRAHLQEFREQWLISELPAASLDD